MLFRLSFAVLFALAAPALPAGAETCPGNPNALGTARILKLDPLEHRVLGAMDHGEALPLEDREVVLTFDDGPLPPNTPKVLDALAAECVKAHFFVVGQMAKTYPALLRREAAEGHTIGTHTERHAHMGRMSDVEAGKEIAAGIATVARVLGGSGPAPFFRFPYLEENEGKEGVAAWLGQSVWSADFHGSDWASITPAEVSRRTLDRLEKRGKGILMLHDIHARTAAALPLIFEGLKKGGYKIVQVVPKDGTRKEVAERPAGGESAKASSE
jgi:peptidoglycan/xylan/chitin deacetylase (PgdA/CDA1 family)